MMKARTHEDRIRNAVARVPRGAGSVPALRRRGTTDSLCSALHACTARTRLQKEVTGESEQARPETEGQAFGLGPRLPRHGLVDRFRLWNLASEFRIGKTLANDLANADIKSLCIGHVAIVESERLLIDVAEQVERFHADVGPVQAALQETPEILHAIGVDISIHVLNRVVDDSVLIVSLQRLIRFQFITEDSRSRFDVLT